MHFGMKEIVIWGALGLGGALAVNHFAELDIPVLNEIEDALVPQTLIESSDTQQYEPSYSEFQTDEDCKPNKTFGDAKTMLRKKIRDAQGTKDWDRVMELKEELNRIDERERESCQ